MPDTQQCTCELYDVTTYGGPITYLRGDPTGCAIHEPADQRRLREAREADVTAAQRRAREAP